MLAQSKTFIDAARKARVQHIVHLGVFGHWDCTDPHIAWHELVETYIEASGTAWTHIHPNMFMEQIPKFMKIRNDRFSVFWVFLSHRLDRIPVYRRGCSHGSARGTSETQWAN